MQDTYSIYIGIASNSALVFSMLVVQCTSYIVRCKYAP